MDRYEKVNNLAAEAAILKSSLTILAFIDLFGRKPELTKYVEKLVEHLFRIRMTERYNPTNNAVAERVNSILKTEWIYHQEVFKDRD